jgi:NADP-dependent 3-hydroxy acid dehydrogenase YdfG
MRNNIASKVVVITEATGASGEAIARQLSGEGASLVLGARDMARLKSLADELVWDGGTVLAIETDVTESPQVARLLAAAEDAFGRVDVMVNNPLSLPSFPFCEDETWDVSLIAGVQILGMVHGSLAAVPHLRRRAGHIINVVPFAAPNNAAQSAVSTAIRDAVLEASEGLREHVAPYGIRKTLVAPGISRGTAWANFVQGKGRFRDCVARQATSVARAVAFAIGQPDDLEINEILFRHVHPATAQSDGPAWRRHAPANLE